MSDLRENFKNDIKFKNAQKKDTRNKIIYIGNFSVYFTTENDIARSFESLGWEVKKVQENIMTEEIMEELLAIEKEFDFILYTRTWKITEIVWRKYLKRTTLPTVSFHLDLYFGLPRGEELQNDSFFWSDYVFSADGGHQEDFKKIGCNHFWLPPGVLEESCYTAPYDKAYDTDVVFVGHAVYHNEWDYRPKLINWLKEIYKTRFRLWGQYELIRGNELNVLYNSAKVVVGDSTFCPNYWSDRIPETLGRAGFLIHPKVPGLENHFTYFKHLVPYNIGDFKSLREIIDYFITHKEERDKIRFAGQKHVKANHTYRHKVKYILDTLKKEGILK